MWNTTNYGTIRVLISSSMQLINYQGGDTCKVESKITASLIVGSSISVCICVCVSV